MSFKKISVSLIALVALATASNNHAMFARALKAGLRTSIFTVGASAGFALSSASFIAQSARKEDYSKSFTPTLKIKQAFLNKEISPESIKQWIRDKNKNARMGYLITPPLVGFGAVLIAPGVLIPAIVGGATGAFYAQYLLDRPLFGEKPIRNEVALMIAKASQLAQIERELAKRNNK